MGRVLPAEYLRLLDGLLALVGGGAVWAFGNGGAATEETVETSPSSVLSGSVTLAASPGLTRSMMDS